MFGMRYLRLTGLTWCQLQGVFKQGLASQCPLGRPGLSFVHCQLLQASSDAALHNPTGPASPEDQKELTQKGIGRFQNEQEFKLLLKPDQPADARMLRVAVVGLPNSGKSTLTNSLLGWRVSSVSQKVHTTRKNTAGIYTQGNTQIVFLDTPGILHPASRKRHNLEKSLLIDPERSLYHADLVCVMVDVSNRWTRNELDPLLLQMLHLHQEIPAVLILNKVDLVKSKEMLLQIGRTLSQGIVDSSPMGFITKKSTKPPVDLTALFDAMETSHSQWNRKPEETSSPSEINLQQPIAEDSSKQTVLSSTSSTPSSSPSPSPVSSSPSEDADAWTLYFQKMRHAARAVHGMKGWPYFKRIFMVSATSGDGVADVKDYLLQSARPGDWDYHSSLVTVQDPREVVLMCVKEKLLEHLKQEMPYHMTLDIVMWEVDEDGMFNIIINVNTKSRRQVSFLLGPKGRTIQRIASEAKQEMMNAFRCEMRLKLIARVYRKSKR